MSDEVVKSPYFSNLSFLRKQESRVSRENGNPVPLYGSLLSQGQRLDSGFCRSDGFWTFYETIMSEKQTIYHSR